MESTVLRRTWAEIDMEALTYNYHKLRGMTSPNAKFMGVVKGNSNGHGAVQVARKLSELGADYLAVATADEARELRANGITLPVLVLGHTPVELTGELIRHNITQAVAGPRQAIAYSEAAAKYDKPLTVHLKVDTGMSRIGVQVREQYFESGVKMLKELYDLPNLQVEGIFTHFSVSDGRDDESEKYTREQFDWFVRTTDALEKLGCTFALRHCCNSSALTRFPEMHMDMCRTGTALMGMGLEAIPYGLKPVMRFKTCIYAVKEYEPGFYISYGCTVKTTRKTRIGVIPAGYADGLFRGLTGKASLMTADGPAPLIGRVCMDMSMIDLTDLPNIGEGDEVEIFGEKQLVGVISEILDTVDNECTNAVSRRVPRIYING